MTIMMRIGEHITYSARRDTAGRLSKGDTCQGTGDNDGESHGWRCDRKRSADGCERDRERFQLKRR